MFKVQGGGSAFVDLSARDAALKARALRRAGLNVEVALGSSKDIANILPAARTCVIIGEDKPPNCGWVPVMQLA